MTDPTEPIVALAALGALLVALFFLFRSLPWSRPGPWRRIWALAAVASVLFAIAESVAALRPAVPAASIDVQVPLFGAMLAASAAFLATYLEALRNAQRERLIASTDPLTGLRNRRALQERVDLGLERGEQFTLLCADLQDFHVVNDLLGSEVGDAVLQNVAHAVSGVARSIDLVARTGGDAFGLFLLGVDAPSGRSIAERVASVVAQVAVGLPEGRHLGASLGAASEADGRSAHQILDYAESAVLRATGAGGGHLAYAAEATLVRLGPAATGGGGPSAP